MSFKANVKLLGADIFIVGDALPIIEDRLGRFELKMISNRGTKVWPGPTPPIHLTDVHRCRFRPADGSPHVSHAEVLALIGEVENRGFEWVHIEKLIEIDGKPAFSFAQGE